MAGVPETEFVWRNGRFVAWQDATIHALSHVVHYGSGVFEGIRCYATSRGPAIFRLRDHVRRLLDSARIYRMSLPYGADELAEACAETVRRNGLEACYLRPIAIRGYGVVGVDPTEAPIEVFIFAWPWGTYLGAEALREGENLFLVRDGTVYTPPVTASILPGITRDTAIALARERGVPVVETDLPREMLYTADEIFLTGTAAEVTPVRSVDRAPVGAGGPGPVTRAVQEDYLAIVGGAAPDPNGWLHHVGVELRVDS
jgi:branched-chain amino acid aminotransferase